MIANHCGNCAYYANYQEDGAIIDDCILHKNPHYPNRRGFSKQRWSKGTYAEGCESFKEEYTYPPLNPKSIDAKVPLEIQKLLTVYEIYRNL